MTATHPPSRSARPTGQALIPIALVLLVGLVGWLTYGARAAERSHRATAESALRDYAAFAGWAFARHAQDLIASRVRGSLGKTRELRLAVGDELPPVAFVTPDTARCGCGFGTDTRFAFRFDLHARTLDIDGDVRAPVRAALRRIEPSFAAAARDGLGRQPSSRGNDPLNGWARLVVDTLGGERLVLAYTIVRDQAGNARAAYGVAADPRSLTKLFDCAMTNQALLPPSLVGRSPNDSILSLRVSTRDGLTVFERGARASPTLAAADTMLAWTGGLVTTVALRPATAASLLIGGMPPSRLPTYLTLLGAAIVLSMLALVQLRRGRELTRMRSQFVANVSHELRTPLAQISMFCETLMLDRERSAEERRHFLSVIMREARRLSNLVEGVLRFSRGEAGASAIRTERRDMAADVSETIAAFQPLASAAEAAVVLDAATPAHAWADPGAVRQVLINLLDNAVKYGPAGQTVNVSVGRERDEIVVSVEDEGPGIPEADRHRVFEPFARLERAGQPRVSGSGIGLSVVRDLLEAHRGRVWVADAEGRRGARVSFALAAAGDDSHAVAASPPDTTAIEHEGAELADAAR